MALTLKQQLVLSELSRGGGGALAARRSFPFPHRYFLRTQRDGKWDEEEVGEQTVGRMVSHGWIVPAPKGKTWDTIEYHITDRGRQALEADERTS
jgi:hypothetical protein